MGDDSKEVRAHVVLKSGAKFNVTYEATHGFTVKSFTVDTLHRLKIADSDKTTVFVQGDRIDYILVVG